MLSITSQEKQKKVIPNVLPCAIKHNGPISAAERYWNPTTEADGTSMAYFRGRKLQGRKIALPEGYRGAVLQRTDKQVVEKPSAPALVIPREDEDDMMEDAVAPKQIETKIMAQQGSFEEIMVWGHDAVPADDDIYVKGMQEWIGFAEAVGRLGSIHGHVTDAGPRCTRMIKLPQKHNREAIACVDDKEENPTPTSRPGSLPRRTWSDSSRS